jgi:hypothetical protein
LIFSPLGLGRPSRETLITRWPRILGDTIAALSSPTAPTSPAAEAQGAEIKAEIERILDEVKQNLTPDRIEADGGEHLTAYNDQIAAYESAGTGWEQIPWLWAECYLYRRLRSFFALRSEWTSFDPYAGSKDGTFASSQTAVVRQSLPDDAAPPRGPHPLMTSRAFDPAGISKAQLSLKPTPETLQTAFHSMLQMVRAALAIDIALRC